MKIAPKNAYCRDLAKLHFDPFLTTPNFNDFSECVHNAGFLKKFSMDGEKLCRFCRSRLEKSLT